MTSNHKNGPKKWHSIQNSRRVNSMKQKKTREQKAKLTMSSNIQKSKQLLKNLAKEPEEKKTTKVAAKTDFYNKRWENLSGNQ